jgi:hypothetical protein
LTFGGFAAFRHAKWSALDEGQKIVIEAILMGEEQAVCRVLVHLELTLWNSL